MKYEPDFRFCKWCGTDCDDFPGLEPDHLPACPQSTGLFPVEASDVEYGMVCMDCNTPFDLGDFYVQRETETPDVAEIVCLGCGMLSAVVGYGA